MRDRDMTSRIRRRLFVRAVLLALVILIGVIGVRMLFARDVKSNVQWEAGNGIPAAAVFLEKQKVKATILTNLKSLDLSIPGSYPVEIQIGTKTYESTLQVVDTAPPKGTPVNQQGGVNGRLEAEAFVTDIEDKTPVTVSYASEPDFSRGGTQTVTIVLTDAGGNETKLTAELTLVEDFEPPVINGVEDQTVTVGGTIAYKKGITVTDNIDTEVTLEVDSSQVNLQEPGVYTVTYTATDSAGNTATATAQITVEEKKAALTGQEAELAELAAQVLDSITNSSMTKKEIALAIYEWCNTRITYTNSSDKSDWVAEAVNGLNIHAGDCFTYFSVAKALLTQTDIPNIDVLKSDTSHSSHFWSLVDVGEGWYHFDTTPRKGEGDYFFLVTDEQLEAYSHSHSNSHIFDHSLYPATPTRIVTEMP